MYKVGCCIFVVGWWCYGGWFCGFVDGDVMCSD